ncbi:MAG: hypothetical protein WCG90_08300 [Chitinophagia bacterium]
MSKLIENPVLADTEIQLLASDVFACIEKHRATVKAILDSYDHLLSLLDDGVKIELEASINNLKSSVDALPQVESDEELGFDELFDNLQNLGAEEIESGRLLTLIDNDVLLDHVHSANPNFVSVKVDSQEARDKVIQFLETEIYPHFNDQCNNILF